MVKLNRKDSVILLNTKYSQSTQSIYSQLKGIRQPVNPASGVSRYYVTITSATYHWQSTSNVDNSRQKSEVIVAKIGQHFCFDTSTDDVLKKVS